MAIICTFNMTATTPYTTALKVNNGSHVRITVNATNNKFNANAATPYTYNAELGETAVDNVLCQANIRNCCFFDYRYLHGGYSTVNEVGTIVSGNVAVESIR